jgi:hypothetical protein
MEEYKEIWYNSVEELEDSIKHISENFTILPADRPEYFLKRIFGL